MDEEGWEGADRSLSSAIIWCARDGNRGEAPPSLNLIEQFYKKNSQTMMLIFPLTFKYCILVVTN